jgi:lysozyme family protein
MTEADIINGILEREGDKYTNFASDKGGPTRWGVTQQTLADFRGGPVTPEQVKALTREEAYEVLEHKFVARSGYQGLADDRVRAMMCDWAVNADVPRATRWLQRTIGATLDGVCGPKTLAMANAIRADVLMKKLGLARQVFYVRTALQDDRIPDGVVERTDLANLEGWLNRNWAMSVAPL